MSRFPVIPAVFVCFAVSASAEQAVSYAFEVQPILSDKCFACHGPDGAKRDSGLRLDTAEGAYGPLKDTPGSAIVQGDPGRSVAWQRINSDDPDEVMPPVKSRLVLTAEEKDVLKRWIAQGAKYEPHWAFQPLPDSVPVPATRDAAWPQGEIDRFVLARLESEELAPSPAADPLRWLRRVTLDLTGLPPTPEEIAAFREHPDKAGAVDRLLASPRFGEHFAVPWLDAARYADSYGYQSDQLTAFWPWRDWVIRSLNANLPIDQFITWQVAGDLLPEATRDQQLATTFNRLHRLTNEGGSVVEEFLVENMADRIHTFGSVFLALTMECSRCHDHKYDPISMRDYYSFGAFFNSIPERGFYSAASIQPSPGLLLPDAAQEAQLAGARQAVIAAEAVVDGRRADSYGDFEAWLATSPALPAADLVSSLGFDGDALEDAAGAPAASANGLPRVPGKSGMAIRLDGDVGIGLPGRLEYDRCDPFTIDIVLRDTVANPAPVTVLHRSFGTDVGYNGIELLLAGGHLEARLVRDWPGNAIAVRSVAAIPRDAWARVTWTYDGSSRSEGIRLYLDGRPLETVETAGVVYKSIVTRTHGDGIAAIGARFRDRGFKGGEVDALKIYGRALTSLEVAAMEDASMWANADAAAKKEAWLGSVDAGYREAQFALRNARAAVIAVEEGVFEIPVMRESMSIRPAHVLARGAYDSPRDKENEVGRNTFAEILIPFPQDAPRDRLGLARWLADPRHPLTSRVFVNRVWANFFGSGIVETSDNFGLQGSLPTHPELLDWMSRDFVSHGWDLKRLCRSIVLGATYGQDSRWRADLRERDPANRLLARGPSRRLSSEQIRDSALAASGLLQQRDGGPPVSPYQPGGDLWRESNSMSPAYQRSHGPDLYRRSLYSVWKRTAPLPNMLAFDSPTREICTILRPQTNTPLQALVLLNDVQFIEAARALAEKVHALPEGERLAAAFIACASRPPTDREAELLAELHAGQLERFKASPEDARKYLAQGDSPAGRDLDPVSAAALAVTCSAILNLDASVWNR
ncbi:DUF1553 domain-containing protein [Luteolibacter flavescens]|uniref:DUF1553 domain-containing protein n=1 Tax=Luteolibacter flavescens TaxID=1859460 RepID=A0ABT3FP46_9BACT|nr:DUF1553 domain-containing protein [Luteolibacter flavescens]MCW1885345.1 DUF1553 domain-containing protein [Luteolibacter flavescens]